MATETQTMPTLGNDQGIPSSHHHHPPSSPQLTVLTRVASIPLISDSLAALHTTLLSNAYTAYPYSAAQSIQTRIQPYLQNSVNAVTPVIAPVITRADSVANKAVDAVESRYPDAFKAHPKEVYEGVYGEVQKEMEKLRKTREHAYGVAKDTIGSLEEKVKSPAIGIAKGVDQRFTPVIDRFASVVNSVQSLQNSPATTPSTEKSAAESQDGFQYQRAYRLSVDLTHSLYGLTNEQIKQIQAHNTLIQRASLTAHNVSETLSTSITDASTKLHTLSARLLTELASLQTSAAQLQSSLSNQLHTAAGPLQEKVKTSTGQLQDKLGPVLEEVKEAVLAKDVPISEKVGRVRKIVEGRVVPVLEAAQSRVGALLGSSIIGNGSGSDGASEGENKANGVH